MRKTNERGRDFWQPRQRMMGKQFGLGDRVRDRDTRDLGTVRDISNTQVKVKWDDGEFGWIAKNRIAHSISAVKPKGRLPNPGAGVRIYGRCLRIEAVKLVPHTYGGQPATAGQKYFHDFTSKNAMIYGMPDGSLRIVCKK